LDSGIAIYGGLFHVNIISQYMDIILIKTANFILVAWSLIKYIKKIYNYKKIILDNNNIISYKIYESFIKKFNIYENLVIQFFAFFLLTTLYKNSNSLNYGNSFLKDGIILSSIDEDVEISFDNDRKTFYLEVSDFKTNEIQIPIFH
jgi:hypothetical protein